MYWNDKFKILVKRYTQVNINDVATRNQKAFLSLKMFEVPLDAKQLKKANRHKDKLRKKQKKYVQSQDLSDQTGARKLSINELAVTNQAALMIESNRTRKEYLYEQPIKRKASADLNEQSNRSKDFTVEKIHYET